VSSVLVSNQFFLVDTFNL